MRQTEMRMSCVLILLVLVTGCVNVQRTNKVVSDGVTIQGTPGAPAEYVHVSNYGYYLFNCFPIFCGNTADDRRGNTIWFSDEVTLPKTQAIMVDEARTRNCKLTGIQPHVKATCFFSSIPYVGTTFGILWYKEVQLSAVLIRPNATASSKGGTR